MTPKELEAIVAKMRALGVTELEGIKLGPVPVPFEKPKEPTAEELRERADREAERIRNIQFAASNIRPYITRAGSK